MEASIIHTRLGIESVGEAYEAWNDFRRKTGQKDAEKQYRVGARLAAATVEEKRGTPEPAEVGGCLFRKRASTSRGFVHGALLCGLAEREAQFLLTAKASQR